MKKIQLNLLHKIVICLSAAVIIFTVGFFVGHANGSVTINVTGTGHSPDSTQGDTERLININTADAEELELLPGIGPALAEAIIEYREEHGGFDSIEEIVEVRGISNFVYRSIRTLITV